VVEGDSLLSVTLARMEQDLLLTTRQGMSARFPGEQVRHLGRVSRGVRGIELEEGDELVDLSVLPAEPGHYFLTVTELGFGKRTPLEDYPCKKHRGGKGVIDIQTGERNGMVVGSVVVDDSDQVMLITNTGRVIRMAVAEVRLVGRNTKGVRLMRLEEGERIVSLARLAEDADALEARGAPDALVPPDGEELDAADGVGGGESAEVDEGDEGEPEDGEGGAPDDGEET
jgi:DNA gyrase subunit A